MWGFKRKSRESREMIAEDSQLAAASFADKARLLARAGQFREAIDLLSAQPAGSLDAPTLRDLVRWRNAAFDPQPGRTIWPPRFSDPFPGVKEPPEISAADLDVEILGGAIQHHGCLLVRAMISPEQTGQLTEVVRKAFDTAEPIRSGARQAEISPWYSPYSLSPEDGMTEAGREFGNACGAIWTGDSPHALSNFIAFLKTHEIIRLIEDYLGERAFLSLGKATLRIVPPTTGTNWH